VFGNCPAGDLALIPSKEFLFIFAFKALPPISLRLGFFHRPCYHYGILQLWCASAGAGHVISWAPAALKRFRSRANVFMGQTEAPLDRQAYVPRMTNSELFG